MARVCVDGTFFEVDDSGRLTFIRGSVGLRDMLIYDVPGIYTFTKATYPGLQAVRARCVGGGGGSAGADANTGEGVTVVGGSGGGYSESFLGEAFFTASVNIVVGAGGAAGVGNNSGGDGGPSSFGPYVVAIGGNRGTTSMTSGTGFATVGGLPGAARGTGQITAPGGKSGGCIRLSNVAMMSGEGGDSGGGYGTGGVSRIFNNTGFNASGYGSGGSGACSTGDIQTGGEGRPGLVIVELYF